MSEAVVLEFEGIGPEHYEAVNERLGIDSATGAGDWPAGLLFHAGGQTDDGMIVIEVWESRAAQDEFMQSRLASALREGGVTDPPARVRWAKMLAVRNLAG